MARLDPLGQRELMESLRSARARGCAVLLSTHILSSAEEICDRLVIVRSGRLLAEGSTQALVAQTGSLREAFFDLTGQ